MASRPLPIGDDARRELNGSLTDMLNSQPWLRTWLLECIADLGKTIETDEGDHFFYLKGGRAIALLLEDAAKDDAGIRKFIGSVNSDWDTQVVINPALPMQEWYRLYHRVHDIILQQLNVYRGGFTTRVRDQDSTDISPLEESTAAEVKEDLLSELEHRGDAIADARDAHEDPPPAHDASRREDDPGRQYLAEIARLGVRAAKKPARAELEKVGSVGVGSQAAKAQVLACLSLHPLQLLESVPHLLAGVQPSEWGERIEAYYPFLSSVPRAFDDTLERPAAPKGPLAAVSMNYSIPWFFLFRLMVRFEARPSKEEQKKMKEAEERIPKVPLRAELIDVSIPRRDTVEAHEQWLHTKDQIVIKSGVRVPGHWYYVDEYILMAREVFAKKSRSLPKFMRRMSRGAMIAGAEDADLDKQVTAKIEALQKRFPLTMEHIAGAEHLLEERVGITIAEQIVQSYGSVAEPGLAAQIDVGLADLFDKAAAFDGSGGGTRFAAIAWVGRAMASALMRHEAARAELMQWGDESSGIVERDARSGCASNYDVFVKALYTGLQVLLAKEPALTDPTGPEMHVVVVGAFAAKLHGAGLCPLAVPYLDLVVYCAQEVQTEVGSDESDEAEEDSGTGGMEEDHEIDKGAMETSSKRRREDDVVMLESGKVNRRSGAESPHGDEHSEDQSDEKPAKRGVKRSRDRDVVSSKSGKANRHSKADSPHGEPAGWSFVKGIVERIASWRDTPRYGVSKRRRGDRTMYVHWPTAKPIWPKPDGHGPAWPKKAPWEDEKNPSDLIEFDPAALEPYHPVFARIRFETLPDSGCPELAFLDGFPVRSLRDLIADLEAETARTTDFERVQVLKDTTEMLVRRLVAGGRSARQAKLPPLPEFASLPPGDEAEDTDGAHFVGWHGTVSAHRGSLSKGLRADVDATWSDLELGAGFYVTRHGPTAYLYGVAAYHQHRGTKMTSNVEIDLWLVTSDTPVSGLTGEGVPNDEQYDKKKTLAKRCKAVDYLFNDDDLDKAQIKFNAKAYEHLKIRRVQSVSPYRAQQLADRTSEPPGRPRKERASRSGASRRTVIPCGGGGDCFFYAVAFHVKATDNERSAFLDGGTYGNKKAALQVRQELKKWLQKALYEDVETKALNALGEQHLRHWNLVTYEGTDTAHFGTSLHDMIDKLDQPGKMWGDPSVLGTAVVEHYGRPLVTHQPVFKPQVMAGRWDGDKNKFVVDKAIEKKAPIRIRFNGINHYEVERGG